MNRDRSFRRAERTDLPRLAEWLVAQGSAPERQCLHSWSGESAIELGQRLLGIWDDGELCFVLAHQGPQLVGALGAEFDRALGRAWLLGPHVLPDEWQALAVELYARLMAALPPEVRQWNAYLSVANARGRQFYQQNGFREREAVSYEFVLTPERRTERAGMDAGAGLLQPGQAGPFQDVFAQLFPGAYYSGERIVAMCGHSHQVLVLEQAGRLLGFAVLSAPAGQTTGEVQFLGVRPDEQGRGHGRRLLLSAVDWLFDRAGVQSVSLNVNQERAAARRLYESVGFQLRFAGIGLSRTVESA